MRRSGLMAVLAVGIFASIGVSAGVAAPPATMTGEHFVSVGGPAQVGCAASGNFSFTASGVAAGPYPGTFTETGTGTVFQPTIGVGMTTAFSATFTVYSFAGDVLVTGTKSLDTSVPNNTFVCLEPPDVGAGPIPTTYDATIHAPTGNYHDEGASIVGEVFSDPTGTTLIEDFASTLAAPVPLLPTAKEQCKNGGWKAFGVFENQGDCVSFVETGGKNPPSSK
jgi:hypothetical protein